MKKNKGEYGYRDSNRKMRGTITLVLAIAIVAQLLARFFVKEDATRNILTVMAILTVLPMANMASPLLASWKYKTPSKAFFDTMKPYENKGICLYDLIITTKEQILPFDVSLICEAGVMAYCPKEKIKVEKAQKDIKELFQGSNQTVTVKIFTDEKSFLRRMETLKENPDSETDAVLSYQAQILKNLSM